MKYPDLKDVKIVKNEFGKIVKPDNRNLIFEEASPEAIKNTLEVSLDNWKDLSPSVKASLIVVLETICETYHKVMTTMNLYPMNNMDPRDFMRKPKEVSKQTTTDRLCENCKEYSLMNAFCKKQQVPKKPKEACVKFIPFNKELVTEC